MKRILLVIFPAILFAGQLLAQKKDLTLEDAVLRQWMAYPTESLKGVRFIPGTNDICAASNRYDTLKRINTKGKSIDLITLAEVNLALGTSINFLSNPYWITDSEFHLMHEDGIYSINLKNKSGKLLFRFPDNAMNLDYHPASKQLAY